MPVTIYLLAGNKNELGTQLVGPKAHVLKHTSAGTNIQFGQWIKAWQSSV